MSEQKHVEHCLKVGIAKVSKKLHWCFFNNISLTAMLNYTLVPGSPANQAISAGDFNIDIAVGVVTGADFYTFAIDGILTMVNNPMNNFDQLNSGQEYSISITATKTTTNIGNFTSAPLTFPASTSKCTTFVLANFCCNLNSFFKQLKPRLK